MMWNGKRRTCSACASGRRGDSGDNQAVARLKDAMNDALRDWVTNVRDTFYCIGTVAGPHPIRRWCAISSRSSAKRFAGRLPDTRRGRLPDTLIAAIGGGSNAMGLFYPFLDDQSVNIIGVEAGGKGVDDKMEHCASLTGGRPGVLHGNRTYLLQDDDGQILEGFSISAGLGLSGHRARACLAARHRSRQYVSDHRQGGLEAFQLCLPHRGYYPGT